MSISKLFSWCFFDRVEIGAEWREVLREHGFEKAGDFIGCDDGAVVSRAVKQPVRRIELSHGGRDYCFFLKQQRVGTMKGWLKFVRHPKRELLVSTRECRLLEMCRREGIEVMATVAWGERRLFFWPVAGFVLADEVRGEEFAELYLESGPRQQRKMMYAYGALVGAMHRKRINSKVRPRDMICRDRSFEGYAGSLVLIDRERGKPRYVEMGDRVAFKQLLGVWHKNAGFLNYPGLGRLGCFWLGYCSERPEFREITPERKKQFLEILDGLDRQPDRDQFDARYAGWMRG